MGILDLLSFFDKAGKTRKEIDSKLATGDHIEKFKKVMSPSDLDTYNLYVQVMKDNPESAETLMSSIGTLVFQKKNGEHDVDGEMKALTQILTGETEKKFVSNGAKLDEIRGVNEKETEAIEKSLSQGTDPFSSLGGENLLSSVNPLKEISLQMENDNISRTGLYFAMRSYKLSQENPTLQKTSQKKQVSTQVTQNPRSGRTY